MIPNPNTDNQFWGFVLWLLQISVASLKVLKMIPPKQFEG